MKKQRTTKRILAFLLAMTMIVGQALGSSQLTVHADEEVERGIVFRAEDAELREGEYATWLYVGETQSFTADIEHLQIAENYTVDWRVGEVDCVENDGEFFAAEVTEPVSYEVSEDGHTITITGTAVSNRLRADVSVKIDGEEYVGGTLWFEIREEVYDYHFPISGEDLSLLPQWTYGINRYNDCYIENPEYPYGETVQFEIMDCAVTNAEDEMSEQDVASYWQWDDGNGWEIQMNSYGHAIGTLTYLTVDGEEATKTFNIWGCDSIYNLHAVTDTDVWNMLPEKTMTVTPEVWLDCYNEEDGHFSGDVSNVTLEWTYGQNDENWQEAFEVSVDEESQVLTVSSKADSMDRGLQLQLRAYVPDENGELYEVAYNEWWVDSCWGYSKIVMTEPVDTGMAVGSETHLVPELWEYAHNEEGNHEYQITENLQYVVEFDTNAFQVTDAEGKVLTNEDNMGTAPFTLKKLENWGTGVNLLAMQLNENQEWQETTRKGWYFDEQHFGVFFEDLRGGDHTWIFTSAEDESQNEECELRLNVDNIKNREPGRYEIKWSLGYYDEAMGHVALDNLEGAYEISEDNSCITLNAGELRRRYNEALDREAGDTSEIEMHLQIRVCEGEDVLYSTEHAVYIREAKVEYDLPTDIAQLPNWGYDIGKYFKCYMENKDVPHGTEEELEILDISVENAEDEMAEEPVAICNQWDDESGWSIQIHKFGHAVATVTFVDENGEEATHTIQIWGSDAIYYVEADINKQTWNLLPGQSMEVTPRAWADFYSEDGNYTEDVTDITYQWTIGANDSNYAEYFEVTENEENSMLTVKALAGALDRNLMLELRAYRTDENGELYEVAYNSWNVNCYGSYHEMIMSEDVNTQLAVGSETILAPELWLYVYGEEGNTEEQITENLQYVVEFDCDAFEITDAEGKVLTNEDNMGIAPFILKKLENWGTEVNLLAMQLNENQDWQEVARQNWYFHEQNFDVWFEDLRDEDYTWIFTSAEDESQNEEYVLNLNTDNIKNKEEDRYDIVWSIGYYDEEQGHIPLDNLEDAYEVSEDGSSITLYAKELRSKFNEAFDREVGDTSEIWMNVCVQVCEGENALYTTGVGVAIREARVDYGLSNNISMFPGMGQEIEKVLSCYIENKDFPHGESIDIEIQTVSVENAEDEMSEEPVAVCLEWANGSGWRLDMKKFGHAVATITFIDENGEEGTYIIQLWGCDAFYYVEANTNTEVWDLLPGESMEVTPRAWAQFYGEYQNYTEDVTDVVYQWTIGANDNNYSEAFEVTEDEENSVLTIEALSGALDRSLQLELRGYKVDENGELYEVAYNSWTVNCCSSYTKMIMASQVNTDLMVGQETTLEPQIWQYNYTEEGNEAVEITEGIRWEVEFDTNTFQVTDAEENILDEENRTGVTPFTVKKLKNFGNDVTIIAMTQDDAGEWYEWGRRDYHFNEQHYGVWFENLRGDQYSWIFASEDNENENEDYTINLNTSKLDEKLKESYEIQWGVGYWNDEGEFLALSEEDGAYEIAEDGTSIILHSNELRSQLKSLMGMEKDNRENIWFGIEARIMVGEDEISMAVTSIEICQPEYNRYRYNGAYGINKDMALNDAMFYENAQIECYVRNKYYPDGEVVLFDITGIDTENIDESEEAVFEAIYKEEDNSWTVAAVNCGNGIIWYHVSHEIYGEMDFAQELEVLEEVYRMNVWFGDSNKIVQGATKEVTLEGVRCYYDEATEKIRCDIMDVSDCIFTVTNMNDDMISISPVENNKFTITAHEGWYGTAYFDVRLQSTDNPDYSINGEVPVEIRDGYYQVFAEKVVAIPGEKIEIPVVLKKFDLEHPNGQVMEDVTYRLESDDYGKFVLDKTGTGVTILENAATAEDEISGWYIRCIAEMEDESGNYIYEETGIPLYICIHNWSETVRTDASCTEPGSATYKCTKCEKVKLHTEKTEEIPANGHSEGEWKVVKEATCTEAGSKEQQCSVCSEVIKTESIASNGHSEGEWKVVKEATCTEAGSKEQKCSVCSTTLKTEEIPANGHSEGEWKVVKEATCTEAGSKEQKCSVCSTTLKTEEIPANGHSEGEWKVVKEATCTEAGSKEQKCSVCSEVINTEALPIKGHTAGALVTVKEAICTEAGSKEQKCSVCNEVLKKEDIAAKGHTFGEWKTTTEATVLKEGVSTRTCACGEKETQSIAKKKGTIKLNVKSISLQEKQSTSEVKVAEITKGDSVAKWSSSNTKVATVDKKGKITGKKAGTAKITVTTKSGATATVAVKVQKKAITTQKITVTGKNTVIKKNKLILKKGKSAELVVTLTPLTSTDKVTYTVSAKDKKIISVSKTGKIKAKKVGKAKITVKSGKKKVVITVEVKK